MLCAQVTNNLSDDTRQAALKVLANSMLLKEETRQMVIDFGLPPTACHGLTYETWDDEFLTSRVIFFCTYTGTLDLESLIDEHHLAEHIIKKLERHDSQTAQDPSKPRAAMQDMALAETLKLLFNVTYYCKQRISSFHGAIGPITSLGSKLQFSSSKPLDPPIGLWINALLNLNLDNAESQSILYTGDGDSVFYKRLVDILEAAFQAYTDDEVDTVITPPITLVAKLYETAPEDVKTYFKTRLLPSSADREKVLGSGDSLPARLLRKSTNPAAMLRNIILELFYNMSDRDAAKFVQNVGYGYASGFLFQNNVPIPESAREAFSTDNGNGAQRDINPITGQFLDREPTSDLPEMTDEEKEREAERLFVLFERYVKYSTLFVTTLANWTSMIGSGLMVLSTSRTLSRQLLERGSFENLEMMMSKS